MAPLRLTPPQKIPIAKNPLEMFSPGFLFFLDQEGILLIDYLPKG